jgi:DNA-directed RNA polymerase subunit RPC12/RpoP
MTVPATTAEWICTRCGTTNRKLLAATTSTAKDRCGHCRIAHIIEPGARPVRWESRLAS